MATGSCGIDCNACRLKVRGLCMSCGAGTGRIHKRVKNTIRPPSLDLERMTAWATDELDPDYWQRLIRSDTEEVCRRAMVSYCRYPTSSFDYTSSPVSTTALVPKCHRQPPA